MPWSSFLKVFLAARTFLLWKIVETDGANVVRLVHVVAGVDHLCQTHVVIADGAVVVRLQIREGVWMNHFCQRMIIFLSCKPM